MEADLETLSFEEAVQLFKEWGFLVEQGPRHGEITIILEGPDHRSYYVCEPAQLPLMASAILRVRWRTGAITGPVLDEQ